jgi:cellulose synthase/poly-beta-1,6-N-acetylglucosamine synthase-like glycosyltransferase
VIELLFGLYCLAVIGLFVFGLNCYVLAWAHSRGRTRNLERLARLRAGFAVADVDLPMVTVQLPIYNERFVVERLLRAVAAFDYPAERLEVQVLDDSTDDTSAIAARVVDELAADGLDIRHVRRPHRSDYKAGALRDGLKLARGEMIAIFDADFVPQPDFLRATVPLFSSERIGLVQARWGHLNRDHSLLTRAQALAIDGHFGVEQSARCWAGWMLNFNGTAGVWRRSAIEEAGGWQADTLTEDLDLSYRAQLAGWRIEYAFDVEVPAEIPADIAAFKSQQRRWAKGSIQTARKLLPRVLRAPLPLMTRVQAVLHLTHYLIHPLMLTVATLAAPILIWQQGMDIAPPVFWTLAALLTLGAAGPSTLYLASQRTLRRRWKRRMLMLPVLMLLGTGIAVSNARAVIEALLGVPSGFVRTPKASLTDGERPPTEAHLYHQATDPIVLLEGALALYSAWGLSIYLGRGRYLIGPFLALYTLSFAWVALLSLRQRIRRGLA